MLPDQVPPREIGGYARVDRHGSEIRGIPQIHKYHCAPSDWVGNMSPLIPLTLIDGSIRKCRREILALEIMDAVFMHREQVSGASRKHQGHRQRSVHPGARHADDILGSKKLSVGGPDGNLVPEIMPDMSHLQVCCWA